MAGPITPEDLYRFRWIDHVRLNPAGDRIAYQVSWADQDNRQNRSRVVVRGIDDPEPVDASGAARREHSPEWSFDGSRLAFVSRRGAADQIFILEPDGSTRQLTSAPEGASSPAWSPDGNRIAYLGMVLSDPEGVVDDPRPPDNREQLRRPPVARVARRLDYKHDGQGYVDGRNRHLFIIDVAGGEARQVTNGPWDVTGFDWAPDSAHLVVACNPDEDADRDLNRDQQLHVVDMEGHRQRIAGGLYLSSPAWSPRGDLIAFLAPNGGEAGLLDRLWVVEATGGEPRCLTLQFDQSVGDSIITDMRSGHSVRLFWSPDGSRIHSLSSAPGVTGAYSIGLDGAVTQDIGGSRRVMDFDIAASGLVAFCASDTRHPGELYLVRDGAETQVSDLNPWLRDRFVAQPEEMQFTAADGWRIQGWMLRPQTFAASRRHPLVLEVHGGPHGQYGWAFFHEFQVLAGMGYMVLYVNPRGSDGYGEVFRHAVVRDWGGRDFGDLMAALDQAIESTGAVDTERLGIGGGSYGGYMTNWAIGQTDRFAAAVSMRSISNLVSEYAQNDIVVWGALELGPPPWPDTEELWRRSPIRYVQEMKTPLLLTCGEMDLRCAISQSEELFGALRLLGKTVELVRFPEESHDLSRGGRPDRRVERLNRIAGWYERFLGTESVEAPAPVLHEPKLEPEPEPEPEPVVAAPVEPVADTVPPAPPPEPEPAVVAPVEPVAEALPPASEPMNEPAVVVPVEQVADTVPPETAAPTTPPAPPAPEAADPWAQPPGTVPPDAWAQPVPPPVAAAVPAEAAPPVAEPAWDAPAPVPAAPPTAADPAGETLVAWPGHAAESPSADMPSNPLAAPAPQAAPAHEATSIMPAWQPIDPSTGASGTQTLNIQQEADSGAAVLATLTFESGPAASRTVGLAGRPTAMGRADDNDVVIGDPATSGRHCRIDVRAGNFWIADLGSTNGTMVNGEPVVEKQLSHGDVIAIGQNTIRFTLN